jgi:hypothetical protein
MPDQITPNSESDDSLTSVSTDRHILVPRPALEQIHTHLTSAYDIYRTRKLRQAIMILEHILKIRP